MCFPKWVKTAFDHFYTYKYICKWNNISFFSISLLKLLDKSFYILRNMKRKRRTTLSYLSSWNNVFLNCTIVKSYNRVSQLNTYSLKNRTLCSKVTKQDMSWDGYLFLAARFYFDKPDKLDVATHIFQLYFWKILKNIITFCCLGFNNRMQHIQKHIRK